MPIQLEDLDSEWDVSGVFVISQNEGVIYAGESENLRDHLSTVFETDAWKRLDANQIHVVRHDQGVMTKHSFKSVLVREKNPILNAKAWFPTTKD